MDLIETVSLALHYLQNKKILILANAKKRNLFIMLDYKIIVINDNCKYALSSEEFLTLYANNNFYIYESDENNADDLKTKDDEYYSWNTK